MEVKNYGENGATLVKTVITYGHHKAVITAKDYVSASDEPFWDIPQYAISVIFDDDLIFYYEDDDALELTIYGIQEDIVGYFKDERPNSYDLIFKKCGEINKKWLERDEEGVNQVCLH